jgi:EAL domain-containing protein (putative c-di-GMP-specific phosphodiesterase class I)
VDIGASIGVVVAPEHGSDPDTLLGNADAAMYEAKEAAAGVVLYRPRSDERAPTRFGMLGQLRRALDRRELVVYYQPKVDIATQQACGAEALVRWEHPTRGLLPPVEFVPVAEASGLISRLTNYVLDAALERVRAWLDSGVRVPVSVNLSARSLDDLTLPQQVRSMLARHRVPAELLCLEITETAIMHDPDSALVVLGELSTAGVKLSLDDFGTGYSSMSYLQRLPVTELKIDRSFVTGLQDSRANDVLVRSTIELGHGLNLQVVAEGVEDAATVATLGELGCDIVQGYYYARPMPAEEFETWLQARRQVPVRVG